MKTDFTFGVDYYPEHWPRERWETDAAMMHELGIQVVRMGEFSWHKMEPVDGEYHFEWLDEALEVLKKQGIKGILGTPSAAPPKWLVDKYPEILPVDDHGQRYHFGGRHHDCQSNPIYRGYIRRFVTAMAEHFKDNDNVVGWQIDNEFGNAHAGLCMCESCAARFREWLEAKYEKVEALNEAWGTYFWSQEYDTFGQVDPPYVTTVGRNPSHMLDWKRFCSDLIVDFQAMQADIIRKICPDHFITHNFMGFSWKVNYFDLAKKLDFITHDQYTMLSTDEWPADDKILQTPDFAAATLELMRGTKKAPFWIMEQQSSITGWTHMAPAPRPGQIRLWTAKSVAYGADTIVYFRWRSCLGGTEQYWHGILPHSGIPSRAYREIEGTISDLAPVMEKIRGAMPKNRAAMLFSYDQEYAMQIQPHHPDLDYVGNVVSIYKGFFSHHTGMDFISDETDYKDYKILAAPLQYLMTGERLCKMEEFVKNGGILLLNMRAGVKDENNIAMSHRRLPGDLADLAGLEVPEYDCLRGFTVPIKWQDGETGTARKWCDIPELRGAEAIAAYDGEFYAGSPAIAKNRYGKGWVYYLATEPDDATMARLAGEILAEAGIVDDFAALPAGVEVAFRGDYAFLMNHDATEKHLDLPKGWEAILGETESIPGYGVIVLEKKEA